MNETGDDSCEIPPSNLPPPPPFPNFLFGNKSVTGEVFYEDEFESLRKAVKRVTDADSFLQEKPFFSHYSHLKSQLQEGPKCGLVALSIATSKTDCFKPADDLFAEALNSGYTSQGEMYNCQNLASLIERTTTFKPVVIEDGIDFHVKCILHCIQNGGLMLVPYDADFNHSPCCRGGRSAHWAVISGVVIFKVKDESESDEEAEALRIDGIGDSGCRCVKDVAEPSGGIQVVIDGATTYVIRDRASRFGSKRGKIFVAGKQGKSRHLALWPFDKLAESNWNLNDLSDEQKLKNFVLAEGGVAAGLKGKAILLM